MDGGALDIVFYQSLKALKNQLLKPILSLREGFLRDVFLRDDILREGALREA